MFRRDKPAKDIETRINQLYQKAAPVAQTYHYTFQMPSYTVGGNATVLFLGNHSSGKSTIINDLLGDPPVQKTGVAPTDDAFTVLLYGEEETEFFGPAALGQLPVEFASLRLLGPNFLQHLAVKRRKRDFLKRVTLIDSPGMIDAPSGAHDRSYHFAAAARAFCDLSDLVLYLFDPDKPGTTGETVDVLSACKRGIEYKLHVVLNKADTFDSMEDYARSYGTLCWNLSRILRTKDLPHIWTTFTPTTGNRLSAKLPLELFERHRGEMLSALKNIGQRRMDSMLANTIGDFTRLYLQARMLTMARRRLFQQFLLLSLCTGGVLLLALAYAYFLFAKARFLPICGGIALLLASFTGGYFLFRALCARFRRSLVKALPTLFRTSFAKEISSGQRSDFQIYWEEVSPGVAERIRSGLHVPFFSWGDLNWLEKIVQTQLSELTALRRDSNPS